MKNMSPAAERLTAKIKEIYAINKVDESDFIYQALLNFTPADFDALNPPICEKLWTSDYAFTKRLAGRIFGVSPETIDELEGPVYQTLMMLVPNRFFVWWAMGMYDNTSDESYVQSHD